MSDQMRQTERRMCRFPGCDRPAAAGDAGTGRPPEYCDDQRHNRATAWRERQRVEVAGPGEGRGGINEPRPIAAATQSTAEIGAQVRDILELAIQDLLPRFIEQLSTAGDPDAAAAQIESVTTEAKERTAAAAARASRAERRAEAERQEADAAAIESTKTATRLEEELVDASAQAEGYQNEASALQEKLSATRETAATAAAEAEAVIAELRNELTSVQTRLEERITVLECEQDRLGEELDTVRSARAEADERARGAVERAAVESTARAERDAARSDVERERSHGEQRLADLRASFQEQLDELRAERTGPNTQVDTRGFAASKPKTQPKTHSVTAQWPELFVGLTPGQRRAVVANLAQAHPDGMSSTRAQVDDMVQYVVGDITPTEYVRRCSRTHPTPVPPGKDPITDPDRRRYLLGDDLD